MKTEVLFYLLFSIVATIYVFYKSIRLRDFDGLTITVLSLGILNSFLCVYILVAYSWLSLKRFCYKLNHSKEKLKIC